VGDRAGNPGKGNKIGDLPGIAEYPFNPVVIGPIELSVHRFPERPMPVIHEISEAKVHGFINRAIGDVFKTMINAEAVLVKGTEDAMSEPWPPLFGGSEYDKPHVVGTVGFMGDVNGLMYLYIDVPFAKQCTCRLLGLTEAELDAQKSEESVNDAVAELTNMSVGVFKNSLCDAGYPCKLTIPSILRGSSFRIVPTGNARRHIFHFDCLGHRVVTDILMKFGD
jgi:chemotaxis protein CheX